MVLDGLGTLLKAERLTNMIIDECLLVYVHTQEEPPPPRLSTRAKASNVKRSALAAAAAKALGIVPKEEPLVGPELAMHSLDELAIIGTVDAMPVMQATRRIRAPTTMAARPRIGRPRTAAPPRPPSGERRGPAPRAASASGLRRRPASRPNSGMIFTIGDEEKPRISARRKPLALKDEEPVAYRLKVQPIPVTYRTLIGNLSTSDTVMKDRALVLAEQDILSEPVLPMHTAIRVVLQASLDLGRPYDANMLAATFGTTRSLVMQSLRKYYDSFVEQSMFTELDFVNTYLWIYGLASGDDAQTHKTRVIRAIELSGAAEPGCRSVFAIARDFVILYVSEVVYSVDSARIELAGLSSVAAVMQSITSPDDVPSCFLEMTNSFLYRARMTGRLVMRAKTELIKARGGRIGSLFN